MCRPLASAARFGLSDEDTLSGLADQVTEALRNAIDGREADPRPLAVGLLGVLGQMPAVFSFKESAQHREQIRELIFAAIAPIVGLQQAIEAITKIGAQATLGPVGGFPTD
jgi:hypothetical protein